MFTEKEKAVLGKYLEWYIAMRSSGLEQEQEDIKRILEKLKMDDTENGKLSVFTYKNQHFAYNTGTDDVYMINQINADVIEAYNNYADNCVEKLMGKYSKDEIEAVLKDIKKATDNRVEHLDSGMR